MKVKIIKGECKIKNGEAHYDNGIIGGRVFMSKFIGQIGNVIGEDDMDYLVEFEKDCVQFIPISCCEEVTS